MFDQGKTVAHLLRTIKEIHGINIVGNIIFGENEIELTKTLIYVQKDA